MNLRQIYKHLVACDNCLQILGNGSDQSTLPSENPCTKCTCWNTEYCSDLLEFLPPKYYPESELPESKKLKPQHMSYDQLRKAMVKAHKKIVNSNWTKVEACKRS